MTILVGIGKKYYFCIEVLKNLPIERKVCQPVCRIKDLPSLCRTPSTSFTDSKSAPVERKLTGNHYTFYTYH